MDISDIELIKTITATGSLSQSCNHLHMSQPTISKKLARLEHVLDSQLFFRYPKGLVPTTAAKYIIEKYQPLREMMSEIERHLELLKELETGQINLGVGPIIEQVLLPQVLTEFVESTKGAKLAVVTESDETLLEMFASSEVDIIVGPFEAKDWQRRDIISIPMVEDEVVAITKSGHPILENNKIHLDQLLKFPLIAPKAQGTTRNTQFYSRISDALKVTSDNYDLLKKIILSTDSICAAPRAAFKEEIELGELVELDTPLSIHWTSALLVRPETHVTPLANKVVSLFEKAARSD